MLRAMDREEAAVYGQRRAFVIESRPKYNDFLFALYDINFNSIFALGEICIGGLFGRAGRVMTE